jgi:hypothetical protein
MEAGKKSVRRGEARGRGKGKEKRRTASRAIHVSNQNLVVALILLELVALVGLVG